MTNALEAAYKRVAGDTGQESRQRRDVDDPPPAALDHQRRGAVRELGDRHDHAPAENHAALPGRLRVAAGHAVAGVVDQDVGAPAGLRDRVQDAPPAAGLRQVAGDHQCPHRVLRLQLARELIEPLAAPRGQHQVVALAAEQSRERQADAGRGTGDERGPASSFLHGAQV